RPVAIRDATDDDLPEIRAILASHGNDGPIVIADVVGPSIRHLSARGGARVAVENDEVLGFAATIDTGRCVHLADLFIRPERLGPGLRPPFTAGGGGGAGPRKTL